MHFTAHRFVIVRTGHRLQTDRLYETVVNGYADRIDMQGFNSEAEETILGGPRILEYMSKDSLAQRHLTLTEYSPSTIPSSCVAMLSALGCQFRGFVEQAPSSITVLVVQSMSSR
jgi:hypothetical protein